MADEPTTDSTDHTDTLTETPVVNQETFSREYVQELRQEAAKARTAKKEALEQLRTELQGEFDKRAGWQ